MEHDGPRTEKKEPSDIDISKLADQAKEAVDLDEEVVKMAEEAFREEENKPAGEWRAPKYEEMLKSQQDNTELNKPVEEVKEGDFSSLKSKQVIYGAAREGMLRKQQEEFEVMKAEHNKKAEEPIEAVDKGPQSSEVYETARAEWKTARDRAHRLEKEFNEKYRAHIASQSMVWRGVRKAFGFQPKLSAELESLQGASAIARREYHAAGKKLAEARETKPMTKYSAVTKTPREFGGKEAVERRYQRMLAYHLVTNVHKERLSAQREAINKVWSDSKVLSALDHHKTKIMFGAAVGATVLTGGTALAGIAAGAGVGIGTYKLLDKTWIQAARKKLASGSSEVGTDFFNKSFLEADQEMEYLVTDVETRQALSKTTSTLAGAAAGITAAGFVSGENVSTPPSGVEEVTPVVPETVDPTTPEQAIPTTPESAEQVTPQESLNVDPQTETPAEPGVTEPATPEVAEPAIVLPEEGPIPEPRLETANIHTVEKNDNVWNILEGKGPDANPVGGKSEVLQGMSLNDRQYWLDKLVEYYEQNPDQAIEVGAVKSSGNIHMIHPGEEINVSMLDDKLRELMGQTTSGELGPDALEPEVAESPAIIEAAPEVVDLNQLRVGEVLDLHQAVQSGDQAALNRVESLGLDQAALQELVNGIMNQGEGAVNRDITVFDHMNSATVNAGETVITPDIDPGGEMNEIPSDTGMLREASLTSEAVDSNVGPSAEQLQQNLNSYVTSVEKPNVGILESLFMSSPKDVSGTFDQISNMNVKDMLAIDAQNSMPEGITEDGWNRWVDNIKEMTSAVPANDNEPVGQYVSRIVNSQAA